VKFIAQSLVVFLGLVVLLLGVGRLWAAPESEGAVQGREHVEQTCVGCHAGSQLEVVIRGRLDPQNRDALDAFLASHHVADPALRADVIAHLEARFASASQEP